MAPRAAGVDYADRGFLTHEDVGLAVVERGDDRLGLNVRQVLPLQRAQERGEREAAERGGEDQVERGADDGSVGITDGRDRVAADVHDVDLGLVGRPGSSFGFWRWTSLLKNWLLLPRSYLMPSSSMSVRSTNTILALIDTWGVRISRPRTNSATLATLLRVSVMISEFESSSAMTLPRPLVSLPSMLLVMSFALL